MQSRSGQSRSKPRSWPNLKREALSVVLGLAVALVVRTAVAEPFHVPSPSMVPTLIVGDQFIASKSAYGYSRFSLPIDLDLFHGRVLAQPPERGDVVVFRLPRDTTQTYVKRLIGLPGDRIEVAAAGRPSINGERASLEPIGDVAFADAGAVFHGREYWETLPGGTRHRILRLRELADHSASGSFVVPAGHYFMMGDNPDDSPDSRYSGDAGRGGLLAAGEPVRPGAL